MALVEAYLTAEVELYDDALVWLQANYQDIYNYEEACLFHG